MYSSDKELILEQSKGALCFVSSSTFNFNKQKFSFIDSYSYD